MGGWEQGGRCVWLGVGWLRVQRKDAEQDAKSLEGDGERNRKSHHTKGEWDRISYVAGDVRRRLEGSSEART